MKKMKILVIPSWYPNEKDPLWGNYFIKQAEALSDYADVSMLYINRVGLKELKKLNKEKITDGYYDSKYSFKFYKKSIINFKSISLDYSFKRYKKAAYSAYKDFVKYIGIPDVILVESILPAGLAAQYIGEKEGIPYVVHAHSEYVMKNPIFTKYVDEIMSHAASYMAVNTRILNVVSEKRKDCHLIPNFIDCKKFDVKGVKKGKDFNLISICNFYKVKALDVLLKALDIVVNKEGYTNVKLKIVGTGENKHYYMSVANSLNLNSNVEFIGYVDNSKIPGLLNSSNVLCVSSTFETFCIPIIEAFASGIPVITTNCDGPLEIVDESNSLVVPINDVEKYAESIIYMLKNYKNYKKSNLKKYVFNRYDKSVICKNILEICKSTIK